MKSQPFQIPKAWKRYHFQGESLPVIIGSNPPPNRFSRCLFGYHENPNNLDCLNPKKGSPKRKTILGFAFLGIRWGILKAKTQKKPWENRSEFDTLLKNNNNKNSSRLSGLKGSVSNSLKVGKRHFMLQLKAPERLSFRNCISLISCVLKCEIFFGSISSFRCSDI